MSVSRCRLEGKEISLKIDEIMQHLELVGPLEQSKYIQIMESQFGNTATKFMDAIDRMMGLDDVKDANWPAIYRRQSKNMEMSHLATAQSNTSIYRAMLEWIDAEYDTPPATVCEIGCNNGLFTLAVGKLWPNSRLVGVDKVRESLALSPKFAAKYDVPNCEFKWLNILKDSACQQLGEFDLVLAPFVVHEIVQDDGSYPVAMGRNLRKLVLRQGRLITINRFPYSKLQQPQLSDALAVSGFACLKEGKILVEHAESGVESFPICVYE